MPCPCRAHALPLPCRTAKGLECVFPIWFTQCGRVWFTLAMPCPWHAPTMMFFSRPRHSTAVSRLPYRLYRGADKSLARPHWKNNWNVAILSSDAEVIAAAETWLDGQPSELYLNGLQKLEFGRCSLFPSWSG